MKNTKGFLVIAGFLIVLLTSALLLVRRTEGRPAGQAAVKVAAAQKYRINGQQGLITERITSPDYENDYPSMLVDRNGVVWVAWLAYRELRDTVFVKTFDGKTWSDPIPISEPGDHFRTAIAQDGAGKLWVVWSSNVDANWDLYARSFDGNRWSAVQRLTTDPGPDIFHKLIADGRGNLWLAWQSFRNGRSGIFLKTYNGGRWSPTLRVSEGSGNAWEPSLVADRAGRIYIGWDGYARDQHAFESYNIYMRRYADGQFSEVIPVAATCKFEAHVSMACDPQDRIWFAWDEGNSNWGKDAGLNWFQPTGNANALYQVRNLRFALYNPQAPDPLMQPAGNIYDVIPVSERRLNELPHLQVDGEGRLWVFFRHRNTPPAPNLRNINLWRIFASYYSGDQWSPLIEFPDSSGPEDTRISMGLTPDGSIFAVWATDQRRLPNPIPPNTRLLYATALAAEGPAKSAALTPLQLADDPVDPVHPNEVAEVARIRTYQATIGGKSYRIFRGDMHRHNDISWDGGNDGSLLDAYRYVIDAARHDYFMATGDHNAGSDQEYSWWRIQKSADLFLQPRVHGHGPSYVFSTLFGYERSVGFPNGHRNVVFAYRGVRTLPTSRTTPQLYQYLRDNSGISMPHTSGTATMGTDWRNNDPDVEPLVEIYQGDRNAYENEGEVRAATEGRPGPGGFNREGMVWNAWAKGYKLGVQASSDHISTHMSYACIYAEDNDRQTLFNALKKRHTYAATDNIILDFRMTDKATGDHMMGDIFKTNTVPVLSVKIIGTGPLERVEVIKNNTFIYSTGAQSNEIEFQFVDNALKAGENYYYVRVIQKDESQVAWSSPIWVQYVP